ncbi:DHA2 family efflux MFS transporter permease subunit [Denitratisoma oestradiolicum]|uniref:MFS transporter n=1 Tax=Denitratisoma oestradiolicum TaxID=311182 RepID=A0A6S6XYW5_9PROT|nr:DHA2 family efflux MFS transporter permease subunit [Denitratisoma oestradiolicum]TWO79166.1 hypothetical protein CBW56_16300 [Denitratisoma oestradiolicum]CAB1369577.1 MFS transporter [Denitratisoma oestradiolicum]
MALEGHHLPPIEGIRRIWVSLVIAIVGFVNTLEMSVAYLALPSIAGDLGVSPPQATWVITSFAVTCAVVTPLSGWLSARVGQVRLFIATLLLFALTSLLCGLANSLPLLIIARCLQGAVVAPMMPVSFALLLQAYPPNRTAQAMSISMVAMMCAPIVGPVIGGWLTEHFSWPWIFYINVPIGLGVAALSWQLFRDRESPRIRLPVDIIGLVLLCIWVGALQIMLDKGREQNWFESSEIQLLGVTSLVALGYFLIWEWYEKHPIVDVRLFANRSFMRGVVVNSLWAFVYLGNMLLLPLWLQQSAGYTATWAGLVVAPGGIAAVLMQPFAHRLLQRGGVRVLGSCGLAMLALSASLRAGFTSGIAPEHVLLAQVFNGIGSTCFTLASSMMIFSGLSQWQIASATGMASFARLMAIATGTSFAVTYWDRHTMLHRGDLITHITPDSSGVGEFLSVSPVGAEAPALSLSLIDRLLMVQAQTLAANDYNWLSVMLFIGLISLVWLSPGGAGRGTKNIDVSAH